MKRYWEKLASRMDALNLRERVLVFACVALVLAFLLNALLIDPLYAQQKKASQRLKQDQAEISRIQLEIQTKSHALGQDPDKLNQEKIQQLRKQMTQLRSDLSGMQKNLVPPEKMPMLLEDILKRNGRLKLVSLKNLPQANLNKLEVKEPEGSAAPKPVAKTESAQEAGAIYRHGVEIVVQGNYMDMMNYLSALENMPWELYWGKVKFGMESYPTGTMTLTVYTLSLDKTWLNL